MAKPLFLTLCLAILFDSCSLKRSWSDDELSIFEAWPAPIEIRLSTAAFSREPLVREISLEGLSGEWLSAQVAVKSNRDIKGLSGSFTDLAGSGGAKIPADSGLVRFGGFIPVDETMKLTADPLLEYKTLDVPANLAQPLWLTLRVPYDVPPGLYCGQLVVKAKSGEKANFDLKVEVLPAILPEPWDWSFHLNVWQSPTPVARAHKVKLWSKEHWLLLERYAENFAAHGMKAIMTHIIHDPWNSVRGYPSDTMVEWFYPGEFKLGGAESFKWDFTNFDRYVELMLKAGIKKKIELYSLVMGPGRIPDAHIRYLDTRTDTYRTARMNVGDPLWQEIWRVFLPVLRRHLIEKGWFEISILGFDEKPKDIMQMIFEFVTEVAPDFQINSSGGYPGNERKWGDEIGFNLQQITNKTSWIKIEPLVKRLHAIKDRYVTLYTACTPRYPNTFLFSQLRESRLMPWLARKYGFDGYGRWAVNIYPEDPWKQPQFIWASGDMFFVYPGKNGPLDSMRWELLRQGIQDYEALNLAWEMAERVGRKDLISKLNMAIDRGSIIDICGEIPLIEKSRDLVNDVIREASKSM
jgi:hypothetical protein